MARQRTIGSDARVLMNSVLALAEDEAVAVVEAFALEKSMARAADDLRNIPAGEFCAWWKQHQDLITRLISLLLKGKTRILVFSVSLPKWLKALGLLLDLVNKAILKLCKMEMARG